MSKTFGKQAEYVVNGKSTIEWIMERYQVTTQAESGINQCLCADGGVGRSIAEVEV